MERRSCCEDELELNEAINNAVDLEWMIEDKPISKKRARICKENDTTITSCKTAYYVAGLKEYN